MPDEEVYEEVTNDHSTLESTIFTALNKIRATGGLSVDNFEYFFNKDPKFARFYLLRKVHKRLPNVPGRPVISNCGYYTENLKILSWANSLIANNNVRSVILNIKTTDVKSF